MADQLIDNTVEFEKKVCTKVRQLLQLKIITPDIHISLKPIGSYIPRIYGIPKVHKLDIPLRPMLSICYSPQHKLAQWLLEIFNPIK